MRPGSRADTTAARNISPATSRQSTHTGFPTDAEIGKRIGPHGDPAAVAANVALSCAETGKVGQSQVALKRPFASGVVVLRPDHQRAGIHGDRPADHVLGEAGCDRGVM